MPAPWPDGDDAHARVLEELYAEPVAPTLIECAERDTVDRDLGDGPGKMAGRARSVSAPFGSTSCQVLLRLQSVSIAGS